MDESNVIGGERLKSFVERIETVERQIQELTEDKKEIFAEAKSDGYDVKVLREVIKLRKQDKSERDEHESLLDAYLHAIATAAPAVYAQAAE